MAHDTPDQDERESGGWWSLLLPTLTFVVGLALGGGLVYATSGGDAATSLEAAAPSASPSPTAAEGGDTTITLPQECEQAGQQVTEAYKLLRRAVGQVRDFDAGRLVETLDELQTVDEETRPLVEACSQVSVDSTPGEDASPSPATSPTAEG